MSWDPQPQCRSQPPGKAPWRRHHWSQAGWCRRPAIAHSHVRLASSVTYHRLGRLSRGDRVSNSARLCHRVKLNSRAWYFSHFVPAAA